eukprot:TRINITY_DN7898_c0_g1_i1.p1 TRINITY_DN7898_c0_g1~~TRINITY_DN7898_c0_g1_i1.p1  ORF type:complete len:375 (-),score=80.86 TRINITY_DN7898_c0_g1_i1:14-1138(-)
MSYLVSGFAVQVMANRGCAIVPIVPSGLFLDLIETLEGHLNRAGFNASMMFYVSPSADHALAYANISGEWCCDARRDKIYLPDDPFGYSEMLRKSRLKTFRTVTGAFAAQYREPCVVFAGHTSLRCGDAVPLIDMLASDERSALLLVEPFLDHYDVLRPFLQKQMRMTTASYPIEYRLTFEELSELVNDLKPRRVLACSDCVSEIPDPSRHLICNTDIPITALRRGDTLAIALDHLYSQGHLTDDFAANIFPSSIGSVQVAPIRGVLRARDGYLLVSGAGHDSQQDRIAAQSKRTRSALWGSPSVQTVLKHLEELGHVDLTYETRTTTPMSWVITVPALQASIEMTAGKTLIRTQLPKSRDILRMVMLHVLRAM